MGKDRNGMTRRDFLKTASAGMAMGIAGRPDWLLAKEDYDLAVISGDPAAATKKAVEALGGMPRFVKKGQRVVLKPNILERSGMLDAVQALKGVHVLALEERKFYREIKVPQGKTFDRVEIMREVLESDVLISIPQAKSHSATGVSLGLKGLMGVIWDRYSFHSKYDIDQAIVDLATVIKPQLTILDATRALVSGGPGGPGEVVKPNLIIAGTDPVAVDSYAVSVAPWYGQNFKGRQVKHILTAHQRGLGKIDLEQMKILKEKA
ncbi:MAG: hypothetical protein H6Q42_2799 [Deltaproteobacteria bacterium]|nr:hypothetical protein [Deltaproteobacteria bacterium]